MEYVQGLTEDEATEKLRWIVDSGTPPPLSRDQLEEVQKAIASLDSGQTTSHAEMKRRFGIV